MIKNLFDYVKEKLVLFKYYKCLPTHRLNSDVYIVEYPKSGITWLSTLVANTNLIISNNKQRATYYNIQQLVPDIHISREIVSEPIWSRPAFRFIKSHVEFCPYYNNVIYLVRNPVSVMNSYYQYCTSLGVYSGSFREFVDDDAYGVDSWIRHVNSWLSRGDSHQRIHVIKYEDLRENTCQVLSDLYINLGLGIDKATVTEAVNLASVERMRESEKHYKTFNPNTTLQFVREGRVKAEVEKDIEVYILEKTGDVRTLLGY